MKFARSAVVGRNAWTILAAGLVAGCGTGIMSEPVHPLTSDSFVQGRPAQSPRTGPLDHPAPPLYDQVRVGLGAPADPSGESSGSGEISKTVRESVRPPDAAVAGATGTTRPSAGPATRPAGGASAGTWVQLGGVLAQVNGTPIYADKILAVLQRPLEAEARKFDEAHFREDAARLINNQVMEYIHAELEFAAAQRNLQSKDEQIARAETVNWRQKQIAKAGGSVEMAKRRAIEDGTDFEETVRQHYRLVMTQLYYQRKVFPLIQVSASDLRHYYDANPKVFSETAKAKFRLIRIDIAKTGGREPALNKAKEIYDRAVAGEDFERLAREKNDDPSLMKRGGDVDWMEKGAFRLDKVEKAVWDLQPGQVSTAIDTDGAFYIARLEAKKGGRVEKFEEQSVQDRIRDILRKQQFNALRDKVRLELENKAVINWEPEKIKTAMDMVMQQYPRWVGAAVE